MSKRLISLTNKKKICLWVFLSVVCEQCDCAEEGYLSVVVYVQVGIIVGIVYLRLRNISEKQPHRIGQRPYLHRRRLEVRESQYLHWKLVCFRLFRHIRGRL